jgi:hypothetical protein
MPQHTPRSVPEDQQPGPAVPQLSALEYLRSHLTEQRWQRFQRELTPSEQWEAANTEETPARLRDLATKNNEYLTYQAQIQNPDPASANLHDLIQRRNGATADLRAQREDLWKYLKNEFIDPPTSTSPIPGNSQQWATATGPGYTQTGSGQSQYSQPSGSPGTTQGQGGSQQRRGASTR